MNSLTNRIALLLLALMVLASVPGVSGEAVEISEESGFIGIYVNNEKVGHAKWELTRAGEGDKATYKIVWTEERTIKDRKENYTHTAVQGTDLSMKSLDIEVKKPGNIMTMKAKVDKNGVVLKAAMGKNALPDRTVKVKPGCSWSAIAPLAWSWRNQPAEAARDYIRLNEFGYTELTDSLTPEAKTRKFQKEDTDLIEWCAEDRKVVIVCSTDGKLLEYTEKSKTATTMLIREPEKVALSGKRFEEFDEPIEAKPGEEKPAATGPVEGDDEGIFADRLAPVGKKDEASSSGKFIKATGQVSIRALDGWTCEDSLFEDHNDKDDVTWRIDCEKYNDVAIRIRFYPYGEDEKEVEHTSDEAVDQADSHALGNNLGMHLALSFKFRLSTLQMGGSCKQYKFPDDAYMYCGRISAHGAKSYKVFWAMVQNSEGSVHAWAMAPEDNWDDVEEDFYKMLGSMRAE